MVNKPMILILNFEPPTMKCSLLSLLCSLLIIAVPADAADLIIVNGGQPGAEIVIGKKRPRRATPAALEQSKAGAEWVNFTEGKTDGVGSVRLRLQRFLEIPAARHIPGRSADKILENMNCNIVRFHSILKARFNRDGEWSHHALYTP